MKIYDVEQNSPEWYACRLGIPTASEFDKLITTTGKPSAQADGLMHKLLAEMMIGNSADTFTGSSWTERGKELEPEAAEFYELLQVDVEVKRVGFVTDDTRTMGCSPDRLVGEDGLLEIKIPAPHTHVGYLLKSNVDKDYYPQAQGQLLVTGRQWVDMLSYHPIMPPVIIRVERDEAYIAQLSSLLAEFDKKLKVSRQILINRGYIGATDVQ